LTFGNLDGQHENYWDHFGDAFVTKTNSVGYYHGSRQFGLGGRFQDITYGVAVDDLGNMFFAGSTEGGLSGSHAGGYTDGFLYKLRAYDGSTMGGRQIGTLGNDVSYGVAVDGLGNGYATGRVGGNLDGSPAASSDAFLIQYHASGPGWTKQFGSSGTDEGRGVSADRLGNVYVSGWTTGDLGGPNAGGEDAFLAKYNASGQQVWSRHLGTSADDQSAGVSTDALGNVYVVGHTGGALAGSHAGGRDGFVAKYSSAGDVVWIRQFGTPTDDQSTSVAADGLGNVFVAGITSGNLSGVNAGGRDAFVSMYAASGLRRWTLQLGTTANDEGFGVATDGLGNVYLTGRTRGILSVLGAPYEGSGGSPFLIKITHVPAAGDFNDDGQIDAQDLTAWSANFGMPQNATPGLGDADSDNDVDGFDFLALQRGLGTSDGALAPTMATPEPASVEIAAAVGLLLYGGRIATLALRRPSTVRRRPG
jgi:hypothetical protein